MKIESLIGNPIYTALTRESAMAAESLGSGLTTLRAYTIADKGKFYGGTHSLATGMERLLKLVIIFAHSDEFGLPLTNHELKNKYGHNIELLFQRVREISERLNLEVGATCFDDDLTPKIISFIADFAQYARYYNLDYITGAKSDLVDEPLARWDRDIASVLIERHFRPTKGIMESISLSAHLDNVRGVSVAFEAEDGTGVRNLESLARTSAAVEIKAKYFVLYVYALIKFGADCLRKLEFRRKKPTYLHEYFAIFAGQERQTILRRKRWRPLP